LIEYLSGKKARVTYLFLSQLLIFISFFLNNSPTKFSEKPTPFTSKLQSKNFKSIKIQVTRILNRKIIEIIEIFCDLMEH